MVILDEADEALLDLKVEINAKYVIALSATPMSKQDPIEARFVKEHLGFAIYDSGLHSDCDVEQPFQIVQNLRAFLNDNARVPKLIFMDGLSASDDIFNGYRALKNFDSAARIRQLKKQDVFIVDDPALMRGRDFSTEEIGGISLLVGKRFPTKRLLHKGFGRVSRHNEPCQRYVLREICDSLVD